MSGRRFFAGPIDNGLTEPIITKSADGTLTARYRTFGTYPAHSALANKMRAAFASGAVVSVGIDEVVVKCRIASLSPCTIQAGKPMFEDAELLPLKVSK